LREAAGAVVPPSAVTAGVLPFSSVGEWGVVGAMAPSTDGSGVPPADAAVASRAVGVVLSPNDGIAGAGGVEE